MARCRLVLALLFAATIAPATAATVRTETIRIEPPVVENGGERPSPGIPAEDIEPLMRDEEIDSGLRSPPQNLLAVPKVQYDTDGLPKPVARMREQLIEAARSGDLERLRMVLEANEVMPTLSFTEIDDPIEFLRNSSGDPDGAEILAILLDVLEAGWVHVDQGTAQEMYVWPYFARFPFAKLTPEQKVEMYRVITAADFAEMDAYGAWLFYRVGIGPDGTLHYFVAGD
ncbi:hypothetical protein [Polymorphum gilvum]|uniref:Hypothetical conserved protein n=1 Tax=Polymorphum gilvum (strain LMG 25793 / CGMCC 1.9160 / SL003B-26A1) TaxID=991905 RepID=F2IZ25_POLGS|nr:hypothetical protein [Polymorphum gilvum]ADZ71748.1 Hypothetical conserved protein [Polymorphum gilvum SL003B-26A1]